MMTARRAPRLSWRSAWGVLGAALIAFAALAGDLLTDGPLTRTDILLSQWFHRHPEPLLTRAMMVISHVHSTAGICAMAAIAALLLAWRRQFRWLAALAMAVPGGLVLNALVKHGFERTRPMLDSAAPAALTYSFPSGHTAGATVWWGFVLLLWFWWEPRPLPRIAAVVIALLMVLLTGLSRVVLGAHYPSDVYAAMAEGIAWLALVWAMARPRNPAGMYERQTS